MLKKIALVVVLAFVGHRVFELVRFFGLGKTVYNHSPGPCRTVQGIQHGSEDMAHIPGDRVLITSGIRFLERGNKHYADRRSGVYMFDFNKPTQPPTAVLLEGFHRNLEDCDFHGLSTWVEEATGQTSVFIVNHLETESVVEIFTYHVESNTLRHVETAGSGDPNFMVLNDVAAVGPSQFYVTNHLSKRGKMEAFLQFKWGFVTYYDGHTSHVATQERFLLANGIDRSADGKYLYIAHIGQREIISYKRNADNTLTLIERYPVYTTVDNIVVDPENGDLWTGCHPIGSQIMAYLEDPSKLSTSQVLRFRVKDGRVTEMHEVFTDDGRKISGSSVAVYRKNQLLIGTVASSTLHCDVKYLP